MSVKKPFKRSVSFGGVFKRRKDAGYSACDGESEELITEESPCLIMRKASPLESPVESEEETEVFLDGEAVGLSTSCASAEGLRLTDCFFLGSYDMEGLCVTGRGCIDDPAGQIWTRTQEQFKPKRQNSLPARLPQSTDRVKVRPERPKYVKLVATRNNLRVVDDRTDELVAEFSYKKISFVGTHPKHAQLFAFIGQPRGSASLFCYAFKCDGAASATKAANTLSRVFQERIKELKTQIHIQATGSMTITSQTE